MIPFVMSSRKIESLGRLYMNSSKYFPLEFLVKKLEEFSCKEGGGEYTWVPTCLQVIHSYVDVEKV